MTTRSARKSEGPLRSGQSHGKKSAPTIVAPADRRPASGIRAASYLEIARVRFVELKGCTAYTGDAELPQTIKSRIGFTKPVIKMEGRDVWVLTTLLLRIWKAGESPTG